MSAETEAFSRVKIDDLLRDADWKLTDGSSVLFEHTLPDGTRSDYVLCDRQGRPMAALEAKRARTDPATAMRQGVPLRRAAWSSLRVCPTARRCVSLTGRPTRIPGRSRASILRTTWSGGSRRARSTATSRPSSPSTGTTRSSAWRRCPPRFGMDAASSSSIMATGTRKTRTAELLYLDPGGEDMHDDKPTTSTPTHQPKS